MKNSIWNYRLEVIWILFAVAFKFASEHKYILCLDRDIIVFIASLCVYISYILVCMMLYRARLHGANSVSDTHLLIAFTACLFNFESCYSLKVNLVGELSLIFAFAIGLVIWFFHDKDKYTRILDLTVTTILVMLFTGTYGLIMTGISTVVTNIYDDELRGIRDSIIFYPITTAAFAGLVIGGTLGSRLSVYPKEFNAQPWNVSRKTIVRLLAALIVGLFFAYFFPKGWLLHENVQNGEILSVILSFTYAIFLPILLIIVVLYRGMKDCRVIFNKKYIFLIVAAIGGTLQATSTTIIRYLKDDQFDSQFIWNHFIIEMSASMMVGLGLISLLSWFNRRSNLFGSSTI